MTTIRKVEPQANGARVLAVFERNAEDALHPTAVLAEGECDLWLAEEGESISGILLTRRMLTPETALAGGIDNLLVDEHSRRQGIGRRLMEVAEAHYFAANLSLMRLAVNVENSAALDLYRSMGYQIVGEYVRPRGAQRRFTMQNVVAPCLQIRTLPPATLLTALPRPPYALSLQLHMSR